MINKKGLILINAYSTISTGLNQATRLKEEFLLCGVQVDIVKNGEFCTFIEDNLFKTKYSDYDFCVYLDKDKYVSEILEKKGVKLFNNHNAIRVCDDKMRTYIALCEKGINVVDTVPGALCYTEDAKIDKQKIKEIGEKLGYPVIVKHNYGSLGQGVFKADNLKELLNIANKVKLIPHLFQKMVTTSYGKDIRVIVIGGKVFASMLRVSKTDFRSNIELGGVGESISLDKTTTTLCEKVATTLNLDYCGIDVLLGENNKPIICEVNSNAFFGGIEKVTNKNVAKRYVEHILNSISK